MAKSIRSKTKRTFRLKKREDGVYAATEAARLHRLNAKLVAVASKEKEEEPAGEEGGDVNAMPDQNDPSKDSADLMAVDSESKSKPISTHGPRGSRREEWRMSKGMEARPKREGLNRQGTLAGRRKSGRSKRRR